MQIMTSISSIKALRELMLSNDKDIIKVSPKDYSLSNGISYCCVELISNEGTNYLIQAIGKEAGDLYTEAILMIKNTKDQ